MLRFYSCSAWRQATQAFSTPCRPRHYSTLPNAAWRCSSTWHLTLPSQSYGISRLYSTSSNADVPATSLKWSGWSFRSLSVFKKAPKSASSFWKIVSLAQPERKPLLIAVGLLLVSSSVSMSIPFTIGKLIDFFSSSTPVRHITLRITQPQDYSTANSAWALCLASFRCSPCTFHYRCLRKRWALPTDADGRSVL